MQMQVVIVMKITIYKQVPVNLEKCQKETRNI